MPQLEFCRGETTLFVYVLRGGRTLVGRSDRCDVALPSESVSRVHFVVEGSGDHWTVQDRSTHGTELNGASVEGLVPLDEGDRIRVGDYEARFALRATDAQRSPTAAAPVREAIESEPIEVDGDAVYESRAAVRITRGALEGEVRVLRKPRTSFGGPGSDLVLDDHLPAKAGYVRVVRGRPMVESGAVPVLLAGLRVRQLTPARLGEEVRLGEHGFVFELTVEGESGERATFGDMIGHAPAMKRLFGVLQRVAASDAPALLIGASGTGKELAARGIHLAGPRGDGPFVAINCAAIPDNLVESELFGHVKGAFTGADTDQDGAFQRADGGTLFLDELGEMKLEVQAKVLRSIESGEVRRVGARGTTFPDVRLVAATNQDLPSMVRQGTFREDLFYRLDVLGVRLPSLRERRTDIPHLARALLARQHPDAELSPEAERSLMEHDWPGNVRELRNVLTRAYVLTGPRIGPSDLVFNPWAFDDGPAPRRAPDPPTTSDDGAEKARLQEALRNAGGNRTAAARGLGIPRSSLLYKLKKFGIS